MEYHIALISDDNYVLPTLVCIKSIINSNSINDGNKIIIHVCTFGLSENNNNLFKKLNNEKITVEVNVFCKNNYEDKIKLINQKTHVTPTALIKFDLQNYFQNIDKLLYIDGDIIVKNNILPLLETNIDNYYLAASFELWKYIECEKYKFGIGCNKFYFNSGVMLLNLHKLRIDNITEQLWNYKIYKAKTNLMDQESLNAVCGSKTLRIPIKWNFNPAFLGKIYLKPILKIYGVKYDSIVDLEKDAAILHYVGTFDKPWKYKGARMSKYWLESYHSMDNIENINLKEIPRSNNFRHLITRVKAFGVISIFGYMWYLLKSSI